MTEKLYEFKITLCGWGKNPCEAWEDAKYSFDIERQEIPKGEVVDEWNEVSNDDEYESFI